MRLYVAFPECSVCQIMVDFIGLLLYSESHIYLQQVVSSQWKQWNLPEKTLHWKVLKGQFLKAAFPELHARIALAAMPPSLSLSP